MRIIFEREWNQIFKINAIHKFDEYRRFRSKMTKEKYIKPNERTMTERIEDDFDRFET